MNEDSHPGAKDFQSILNGFTRSVHQDPGKTAVRCGDRALTYAELDDVSDGLAAGIARTGLAASVVAVMLPRGVDFVAALLAVGKAGAAFLPLDPSHPRDRLERMLGLADLCVTTDAGTEIAGAAGVPTIGMASAADPQVSKPLHPEQSAYVLFTSGTTGVPKAVRISHASLANHASALSAAFGLVPSDRVLQFATYSFDVAVEEIFSTLRAGAEIVVLPTAAPSIEEFSAFLLEEAVTVVNIPTPYWEQWVRGLESGECRISPSLRLLIVGSDMTRRSTLAAWRRLSSIDVINAYGLTESTITATTRRFSGPTEGIGEDDPEALPIGSAVSGLEAWVLDETGAVAGPGETGEIHIGGAGVAQGYHADPVLTADRFVPDAISGRAGARLYRTGDRGHVDAKGDLRVLGRADDLVKIRGQRVHPQEVVRHLTAHPHVASAHVLATPGDHRSPRQLVAYIVPTDPHSVPTAGLLRAHLGEALPAAHIPDRYVVVDALPLRSNGKIDVDALPQPLLWGRSGDVPLRAPATPVEIRLVEIWREVLRVDELGVDDSVFDLGGHSLALMQIANQVRRAWQVELTVQDVMSAPTIARLAVVIGSREQDGAGFPSIVRAGTGEAAPLTSQQQQVWFLDRLAPGNVAYHAQTTMRVVGTLDIEALRRAIKVITARQSVFRTTFHERDGVPYQQVHDRDDHADVEVIDISGLPAAERRPRTEELVRERITTPFDLGSLPLARWSVVRQDEQEYEIVLVEHHLIHDGWSFGLLMKELRAAYTAEAAGTALGLPPVEFDYADYARWQAAALDSPAMERRRDYWLQRLADRPAPTALPTSRPRKAPQSFRGGMMRLEVPARTASLTRRLARDTRSTVYSVMLAAFQATLARFTGEKDIVVGSAFANRQMAEVEDVIGMFVNPVVLRTPIPADSAFRTLLDATRKTVAEAAAHQEFPFLELVRSLNPDRDPTANPGFQIMFSANDSRMPDLELPGAAATVYELDNGSAKVDLNIVVIPRAEAEPGADGRVDSRIAMLWAYNSDLFDAAFLSAVGDSYLRMLDAVVADPDTDVLSVDILGPTRSRDLLSLSPALPAEAPTALESFEAALAEGPDRAAVWSTRGSLTYAQLATRARAVIRALDGAAPVSERPVALLLGRTTDTVAAMTGILLSGRGYLPLDPNHPAERTSHMLRDSDAGVVLVDSATRDAVPPGPWSVIDVSDLRDEQPSAEEVPFRPAHPEATAWVIYTSGSTGQPKGCRATHRNLARFVQLTLDGVDRDLFGSSLAATSFSFDMSVNEIFPTLFTGGSVVLVDSLFDLPKLPADRVPRQVNAVPSLMSELLIDHRVPDGVQLVNLGGESGSHALVERLRADGVKWVRVNYGPTETTVYAVACEATPGNEAGWPIGTPGPGSLAYVLDDDLRPVPYGCEGELVIGGPVVTSGYVGRARLNADRFVPDPFTAVTGDRMYRTGDRVRWRDGRIEYLGRRDHQVKIRGLRIELGEIEHVLRAHPGVAAAFVQPHPQAPTESLLAYVRPAPGHAVDADSLAAHAGRKLPASYLPSGYVVLDDIPLTTSGKVDRSRLPVPALSAAPAGRGPRTAPEGWTELERRLAAIWSDVLRRDAVDRGDNLFLLGGHSLTILRLQHRIQDEIDIEVPLPAFFAHPTVADLAGYLTEETR
ncbi:non-ribosomal peptide synthetase [Kitasatospora purpeofusca]|uniref:non-ribosomal peptide synthetase n=1 Tax=Kitasatospora purpeofusca TaxID=67352 RepID=UPI00099D984D|nr:non-ribosomal peptide synthetase [Kitasatospora purpeofusca]